MDKQGMRAIRTRHGARVGGREGRREEGREGGKEGGRKEGAREGKHLDQVVEIGTGVVTASLTGAGSVDGPRIFLEAGFGEIHVLSRAGRRAGGREGGRAGGVGLVPEGREQES
jgi:hypothetical protein